MKAKKLMKYAKAGDKSKVVSEKSGKVMKAKKLGSGRKKSIAKKLKTKNIIPHTLENAKVQQGVSELVRITGERNADKPDLFDNEGHPILLSLSCFRIVNVPTRILRFVLPHPLIQETSDVALIVKDLEPRKRRPDNDAVIDLYEKRIFAHGISHPIKVIPIRQVMTEYNTYEAKKQLCNQYDVFLADARVSNRLTPILGRAFSQKRKNPIPVKIDGKQMKQSIEKALTKSSLKLSADGATFTMQVGHTAQKPSQIAENIVSVVDELCRNFPGGWPNIRNLVVKTAKSIGIPLYVSITNPNDIKVVINKPKLKHGASVEGELSTALDAKVRVYPSGLVKKISGVDKDEKKKQRLLKRKQRKLDRKATAKDLKSRKASHGEDSSEEEEDEEDEDMSDDDLLSDDEDMSDLDMEEADRSDMADKVKKADSYESDSEDPEADEAEEAYLNELSYTVEETETKATTTKGNNTQKTKQKGKSHKQKKSKSKK